MFTTSNEKQQQMSNAFRPLKETDQAWAPNNRSKKGKKATSQAIEGDNRTQQENRKKGRANEKLRLFEKMMNGEATAKDLVRMSFLRKMISRLQYEEFKKIARRVRD